MTGAVFNQAGIALVAMDWAKSGVRADQVIVDASAGCPPDSPVLVMVKTNALTAPSTGTVLHATTCDLLLTDMHLSIHFEPHAAANGGCATSIDVNNMGYFGHSLGGFVGGPLRTTTTPFKAVVLNVTGIGWRDAAEDDQQKMAMLFRERFDRPRID